MNDATENTQLMKIHSLSPGDQVRPDAKLQPANVRGALPVSKASDSSAVDRTVLALRRGIEEGRYAPGQRLVEPDLTRDLKVSRSSLREAFRRLSAEGVIDIIPNKGAIVRRLSVRDVYNVQQIRNALEPLAASLAAAAIDDGGNRARFEEVAAVWIEAPPVHDMGEFGRENRRFHRTIVEISGNHQLATILEGLNLSLFAAHFRLRITTEASTAAAAQHRAIAMAIRAGDSRAAREAMKRHIAFSNKIVLSANLNELSFGESATEPGPARVMKR